MTSTLLDAVIIRNKIICEWSCTEWYVLDILPLFYWDTPRGLCRGYRIIRIKGVGSFSTKISRDLVLYFSLKMRLPIMTAVYGAMSPLMTIHTSSVSVSSKLNLLRIVSTSLSRVQVFVMRFNKIIYLIVSAFLL